jgi:hypothetical protein
LSRFRSGFLRGALRFGGGFSLRFALQMVFYLLGDIRGDGTRVRLFLGDAKTRQKVNNGFRLDLELACQLIDADLGCVTHAS